MSTAVLFLLQSSLRGGILILAVLLLRALLRRLPKRYTRFLWTAVWLRLALPFAVRSRFSFLPAIMLPETPAVPKPEAAYALAAVPARADWPLQAWAAGVLLVLTVSLLRYLLLKRRVREAIPLRDKLWLCDWVETPFLLGLLRPRIYLPSWVEERDVPWIAAHEEAHLRCGDPWRKLAAFLLTAVYWFQPLVWVAFFLYRRDLELACDEQAVRDLGAEARASYVRALMRASTPGRSIWAAPLGFGSAPVMRRVEALLHPRRCGRIPLLLSAVLCAAVLLAVTFEPVGAAQAMPGASEHTAETVTEPAQAMPGGAEQTAETETEATRASADSEPPAQTKESLQLLFRLTTPEELADRGLPFRCFYVEEDGETFLVIKTDESQTTYCVGSLEQRKFVMIGTDGLQTTYYVDLNKQRGELP